MSSADAHRPDVSATSGEVIAFPRSIHLDVFILLTGAVMLFGAIRTLLTSGDAPDVFTFLPFELAAWGSVVLCGWVGFDALRRILDPRPRLILSEEGLRDRTVHGEELFLRWSEIKDVTVGQVGSIEIWLRDVDEVRARLGPRRRRGMWLDRLMRRREAPVALGGVSLKGRSSEIAGRIQEELDRHLLMDVRDARNAALPEST